MINPKLLAQGIDATHSWALVRMPGASWRLAHALGTGDAFTIQAFDQGSPAIQLREATSAPSAFTAPLPSIAVQSTPKKVHIDRVKTAKEHLRNGFEKVVLSRTEGITWENAPALDILLQKLEDRYPLAYVAAVFTPENGLWMGASPERLLAKKGDTFQTMALAGTRKQSELAHDPWTPKEAQEQRVVTIDILERLQPHLSAEPQLYGPIDTPAAALVHLCTSISFKSETSFDVLAHALHPTPAVCGFPRREAQAFIAKHEDHERGLYCGFMGWTEGTHSETCVWLRCMQMGAQGAVLHIGGGITSGSDPEAEWQETVNKAKTLTSVLQEVLISPV